MALNLLQPLHVPRPPRPEDLGTDPQSAVAGLSRWAATLSGVLNTFIQQVQEVGEAFITAPSSANLDTGVIQGYQLIVTSALITVAAQIQDAIITNAKVVSLTSDKIYLGSTSGNTLTTSGSTLILPGLLQISAPDSGALSLFIKGTASGIQDTGARSLRINGVEQYTTSGTLGGLSFNTIATSGTAGAITVYAVDTTITAGTDLANAILGASPSALIVLSSYNGPGSAVLQFSTGAQGAKDLGSAMAAMGLDVGALEGLLATGGNGGSTGRIPLVGLGFRGGGPGSGLTIYTNGSSNAAAAVYQGFLMGNLPGSAAQFSKTTIIEGGSIRTGSIVANKLTVSQLSAIAADMGTINAGTINGGQIVSGATSGAHTRMGPSGVQVFDAAGTVLASLSTASNNLQLSSAGGKMQAAPGASLTFVYPATGASGLLWEDTAGTVQLKLQVLTNTAIAGNLVPEMAILQGVNNGSAAFFIGTSTAGGALKRILVYTTQSLSLNTGTAQILLNSDLAALSVGTARLDVTTADLLAYADLRPAANAGSDIGNAAARWKTAWLSSGAFNLIGQATQSSALGAGTGALSLPTAAMGTLSVLIDNVERRIPFYAQG